MPSKPQVAAQEAGRNSHHLSTGPRTLAGKARVSRNALKHGRYAGKYQSYAQSLQAGMLELNEDPGEYGRIQQALLRSFEPASPVQAMLVEDIAWLRWERRRLERARAALLARRVQELEIERQRMSLEVHQKVGEEFHRGHLLMGMMWVEDCPSKFQRLLEWLGELQTRLEVREFAEVETTLGCIYGPNPSLRGVKISALFRALAQADAAAPLDASQASALRREVLVEISNVTQLYHLYLRRHVEITPTMRQECLAPTADQRWLMRQLNMVDRQIERKIRLLMEMQQADRAEDGGAEREAGKRCEGEEPEALRARGCEKRKKIV